MPTRSSQLELLKSIASRLVTLDVRSPSANETIFYPILNRNGTLTGLSQDALPDLEKITKSMRENREDYIRGVDFRVMCRIMAEKIIEIFQGRSGDQTNRCDLVELKQKMEEWFTGAAVTRRHFVPSNILPEKARAFEFGPIRFFHVSDLNPMDYGLSGNSIIDISFNPLKNMMQNHAACWLGEVLVEGCEKKRSAEIAGLAVDIALGGLQLLIPSCYSRRIARITARTLPSSCGSFVVTDTGNVE